MNPHHRHADEARGRQRSLLEQCAIALLFCSTLRAIEPVIFADLLQHHSAGHVYGDFGDSRGRGCMRECVHGVDRRELHPLQTRSQRVASLVGLDQRNCGYLREPLTPDVALSHTGSYAVFHFRSTPISSCSSTGGIETEVSDRGLGCGGRIRTCDLRVMSPASYYCSTPQGGTASISARGPCAKAPTSGYWGSRSFSPSGARVLGPTTIFAGSCFALLRTARRRRSAGTADSDSAERDDHEGEDVIAARTRQSFASRSFRMPAVRSAEGSSRKSMRSMAS